MRERGCVKDTRVMRNVQHVSGGGIFFVLSAEKKVKCMKSASISIY